MDGVRVSVIAALIVVGVLIVAPLVGMVGLMGAVGSGGMMGGYRTRAALALGLRALVLLALVGGSSSGLSGWRGPVTRRGDTARRRKRPLISCAGASPPAQEITRADYAEIRRMLEE